MVLPPKGTFLRGNTYFEPQSVKIGTAVRAGRVIEKKRQDSQKSHNGNFPYVEKTPLYRLAPKFAW